VQRKGPALFLFLLALALCIFSFWVYQRFYTDDAFISLRYADNFLKGHGLVWNPGERVEGYTNFSQVMLVAFLGACGLDLVMATRVIGVASFLGLNLFIAWYLWREMRGQQDSYRGAIPLLLTLTALPLIIWAWGGLETVLFTLFVTMGAWMALAEKAGNWRWLTSGAAFGLAALTRPEGVLFAGLTGLFVLYLVLRRRARPAALLYLAMSFTLLYLPYFAWRLTYYGALLPNTFYVRTGPLVERLQFGLAYAGLFFQSAAATLVLPLTVLVLLLCLWKRRWEAGLSFLAPLALFYTVYVILVGGDHMQAFRFFAPILPIGSLMLLRALRRTWPQPGRRRVVAEQALLALVLVLQTIGFSPEIWTARFMDRAGYTGAIAGRYIAANWPAGSLVALNTAGSTPYSAPDLYFLDMLGVNDAHIARRTSPGKFLSGQEVASHGKGDGAYVLSRKPDYIILGPAEGATAGRAYFLTDYELEQSSEFAQNYQLRQVDIDVSQVPDADRYAGLQGGVMTFTFYQRVKPGP
jgi:hypothetical protein